MLREILYIIPEKMYKKMYIFLGIMLAKEVVLMDKLYRGIFWIKDVGFYDAVVVKVKCSSEGLFTELPDFRCLAKSGKEFNHQATWKTLSKTETEGKEYNYYPRGRVQIKRGKAIIYANGNIASDKLLNWAIREFNLSKENGINLITIKSDMSNHYLCYLDKER